MLWLSHISLWCTRRNPKDTYRKTVVCHKQPLPLTPAAAAWQQEQLDLLQQQKGCDGDSGNSAICLRCRPSPRDPPPLRVNVNARPSSTTIPPLPPPTHPPPLLAPAPPPLPPPPLHPRTSPPPPTLRRRRRLSPMASSTAPWATDPVCAPYGQQPREMRPNWNLMGSRRRVDPPTGQISNGQDSKDLHSYLSHHGEPSSERVTICEHSRKHFEWQPCEPTDWKIKPRRPRPVPQEHGHGKRM